MRQCARLLLFLLLIISSCKKTEFSSPGQLVGKWVWAATWYDIAPGTTNPLTPMNSDKYEYIELNPDYSFKHIWYAPTIEDMPSVSGKFSVGHGNYAPSGGGNTYSYDSIVFYSGGIHSQKYAEYFKIHNDTLIFSSGFRGVAGSGSRIYVKENTIRF